MFNESKQACLLLLLLSNKIKGQACFGSFKIRRPPLSAERVRTSNKAPTHRSSTTNVSITDHIASITDPSDHRIESLINKSPNQQIKESKISDLITRLWGPGVVPRASKPRGIVPWVSMMTMTRLMTVMARMTTMPTTHRRPIGVDTASRFWKLHTKRLAPGPNAERKQVLECQSRRGASLSDAERKSPGLPIALDPTRCVNRARNATTNSTLPCRQWPGRRTRAPLRGFACR